eukprot:m.249352 g.249352  ORF g.249352 m.249352 type:complete len:428 (+) comp26685_c1_seq3:247-1530(+)
MTGYPAATVAEAEESITPKKRLRTLTFSTSKAITLAFLGNIVVFESATVTSQHLGNQPIAQHGFSHWFVHQSGGGNYNDPPLVVNGSCVNVKGYISDIITDDVMDQIKARESAGAGPWHFELHFTAPHAPYTGADGKASSMHPAKFVNMYENCSFDSLPQNVTRHPWTLHGKGGLSDHCFDNIECWKGYYAATTAMDWNIGRVLQLLDDLNITNNTLVIFASDHGFNLRHHGMVGKGNAGYPLNMFDTSLLVPMIWRHPGVIPATPQHNFVQVVDFAPTLLAYIGSFAANPTKYVLPDFANQAGSSFVDLLKGQQRPEQPTIVGEFGACRSARNATHKLILRKDGPVEVYDLNFDAQEMNNLAGSTGVPPGLRLDLDTFFGLYADPFRTGWNEQVTGAGQLEMVGWGANASATKFGQQGGFSHYKCQ